MNVRTSVICAAGVCVGIGLYGYLAGGSARVVANPAGADAAAGVPAGPPVGTPRLAPPGPVGAPLGPEAADRGLAEAETPAVRGPVVLARRSLLHRAVAGATAAEAGLGEPALRVRPGDDADVTPAGSVSVAVLFADEAEPGWVSEASGRLRDRHPGVRIAVAGFLPGEGAEAAEADAATLASVDLLAPRAPAGVTAASAEAFFERCGRRGRRVLALIDLPRETPDLSRWEAAFGGALAAGVDVLLLGEPGTDPAVTAAWREDVDAHHREQRRLAGIAYD